MFGKIRQRVVLYCALIQAGFLFTAAPVAAQLYMSSPRIVRSLDPGWLFRKATGGEQVVDLPHTWNSSDVSDDTDGYYRGVGWYRKRFAVDETLKGKDLYLYFEGANQHAEVYVNGDRVGEHVGGYTAFIVPLDASLRTGNDSNEVTVKVDNRSDSNIAPLSADFTFYGGLYRHVHLVALNKLHFSCTDDAAPGVYISSPAVSANSATLQVSGCFVNHAGAAGRCLVSTVLTDANGHPVSSDRRSLSVEDNGERSFNIQLPTIGHPHLWSPDAPYLYTATVTLTDLSTGAVMDRVRIPVGLRWFRFDADKGFFLNGKYCRLAGISRHQDYPGMGNALPDSIAVADVLRIKKMGGNFFRIAHYPQSPAVLKACDSLGILASVEIPIVNEITESDSFYTTCRHMQEEMIRQNFNHPSVIIWGYMNEILLRPHFNNDKDRQQRYFRHITELARSLDSLTRKEDPGRYTLLACHGDFNKYRATGLTDIPMLLGWNLYSGWYGGQQQDFAAFLDRHHKELPGKPFMITEYGADADARIRSLTPQRFDKSVEFATSFHRYYWDEMLKRPWVAGSVIWILADFNSEKRAESMPHFNTKGLMTGDRTPKDPYYFYQARLLAQPFVAVASKGWTLRAGVADSGRTVCYQPVEAASNLDSLELWNNGQSLGRKKVEDGWCTWQVPFTDGVNHILVSGQLKGNTDKNKLSDGADIDFQLQPYQWDPARPAFHALNVLLGAKRYFVDAAGGEIWQPEQAYHRGSWGYIDGQPFRIADNSQLPYGTDKNIKGTDLDPVYQTQRVGLHSFRLDVPAGHYECILHFAELDGSTGPNLPYNLHSPYPKPASPGHRVFDVYINDKPALTHFDITDSCGTGAALKEHFSIRTDGEEGIRIDFRSVEGEPVLNALQVKRIED